MKKFTYLLVIALALTVAASGCKKRQPYQTPLPGSRTGQPGDPGNGTPMDPGTGVGMGDGGVGSMAYPPGSGHAGWSQNASAFETQAVYFDYDSATIKGSEKSKVQVIAAYLQSNPNHAVLVEGNCDERGTEEYNRALGERRAIAARELLIGAGISPDRVDTISYGEDKPADTGHDDAAWHKNRRDSFILLTPP